MRSDPRIETIREALLWQQPEDYWEAQESDPRAALDAVAAELAALAYIASNYECYCETPGTSDDCAVCTAQIALAGSVAAPHTEPTT